MSLVASISLYTSGPSVTNFFAIDCWRGKTMFIVYNKSQAKLSRCVIIENGPFGSHLVRPSNRLDPPVRP